LTTCGCGKRHRHPRIHKGGRVTNWAPDIVDVVSDIPHMAAEADAIWDAERELWGPERTVGEAMARIDEICRQVLIDNGYTVGWSQ
jgi:hypothetical protein